jgi:anti-sigma-K factor RskA
MSDKPCDYGADAPGWVLGALSEHEAARFEGHLRDCPACRAEVERLAEAAALLLLAAAPLEPPLELRGRLLVAVEADTQGFEADSPELAFVDPPREGRHSRARTGLLVALAAGAIAAAAAAVVLLAGPGQPMTPRTVLGRVTLQGGAPRARATVVIRPKQASLVVTDLAPPPPGQLYQTWVVPPGSAAIPAGAQFSPGSGDTRILLPSTRGIGQVIVTAETPGFSLTPTPPVIVVVDLQLSRP